MSAFGYLSTMMNHAAISLDRLNAVTRPAGYSLATDRDVAKRILVLWTVAAIMSCHQIVATYPKWPAAFDENIFCPMSKVRTKDMLLTIASSLLATCPF